jgi:hypothetical protein
MRVSPPRSATLIACLVVAGCVTAPIAPTAAQYQTADFGACPVAYQDAIHRYFDDTLKDPNSVQYREVTAPETGSMQSRSLAAGNKITYGWLVKATINAKNTYGGYVGFRTYSFLFRGEQIVDTITPDAE